MANPTQWSLARRVVVRMAGFPVSWLLRLQSVATTGWVRGLLALEADLTDRRSGHLSWLFEERRATADASVRKAANRAARLVWQLRPVPQDLVPGPWAERLEPWNEPARKRARLLAEGSAGWAAELKHLENALRRTVSSPALQEAIFLNSPDALTGIRRFTDGRGSAPLRRLAVRYLQRFCVKVETGGFYGPINHGELSSGSPDAVLLSARGDGRTAPRRTLLSYWAAQAIADRWAQDEHLTGLLRLYRAARNDAGTGPAPDPLLMALATGEHTVRSVARRLGQPLDVVWASVLDAQSRGWLRAGIRIPAASGDPLAALRQLVENAPEAHNANLMDTLASVRRLLSHFEKAGLPERERLLVQGNEFIESLTGTASARKTGSFYADRFWYTEEAIGNIDCIIFGQPLTAELPNALTPALDILASIAVDEKESQHETVQRLLKAAGGVIAAENLANLERPPAAAPPAEWADALITDGPQLALAPEDLSSLGMIRGDLDLWPLFCAPDLMLIARDREQLNQGDWQVILSEVHHICPQTQLPFAAFDSQSAQTRAELWAAVQSLTGPARPLLQGIDRQHKVLDYTPAGHAVLWLNWQASEPDASSIRVGDCTVKPGPDGRPALWAHDGTPLALFPDYEDAYPDVGLLLAMALPGIDKQPLRLSVMTPRITIGRVVYQRQRWDLTGADLPAWQAPAGSFEEYLAAWRWKTAWKMPDQIFARVPGEEKPLFLDFCSPLSVDTFLRAVAGCDRLGLDEMLPDFDHLWLEIGGERYCCELRFSAFRQGRTSTSGSGG